MKYHSERICPIISFAEPKDGQVIAQMFKEIYSGTYPYKSMEDVDEVCKMVKSPNYLWFLFKLDSDETVGCFWGSNMNYNSIISLYIFLLKIL